jgi:cyclin C
MESNTALNLPPPPTGAAEFIASFEVSLPVLLACVQDILVLYPIWEGFEPSARAGKEKEQVKADKFGPEEAEALVRRMIEERAADLAHPVDAGKGTADAASEAQIVGKKRKH